MQINSKKEFCKLLKDTFIGIKPDNKDGFSILYNIKSEYYDKLENILQDHINELVTKFPEKEQETYKKIYDFFRKYFTKNGSLCCCNNSNSHNDQELYYVKTDYILCNKLIEIDNSKFYFDVTETKSKKSNERRYFSFQFSHIKQDNIIVIKVHYTETENDINTEQILNEINKNNQNITEEQLTKAIKLFKKEKEYDFYINKNPKSFLLSQLKQWYCSHFWNDDFDIEHLKAIRKIILEIIDYVSNFENKVLKIWNKIKIVKDANYVFTLDKIKDVNIIKKIITHKNITAQIKEWQELDIVDDKFNIADLLKNDLLGYKLEDKYKHLFIDTKYIKDIETEILEQFEDLDESLDGWLIKSENYQALNSILPKFKNKIQTVYIDPPFNLNTSDQFLYRTNYNTINWVFLLENRLSLIKDFMNDKAGIFLRCNCKGNWLVRDLMNKIFEQQNFRNEIVIKKTTRVCNGSKKLDNDIETLYFYSKTDSVTLNILKKEKTCRYCNNTIKPPWNPILTYGDAKNDTIVIEGKTYISSKKHHWILTQDKIDELLKEGEVRINYNKTYLDKYGNRIKGLPEYLQVFNKISNNWLDISGYNNYWGFQTENAEILLKRVLEINSSKGDLVIDFFSGSGTTTAVAHKLSRKWIGIELGNHFYNIIIPRLKKVLFYDSTGITKDVKEYKGGGFFKYYELEQFEETLSNLEKVNTNIFELYPTIDIAETLSNLLGKNIKRIKQNKVIFQDGTAINYNSINQNLINQLLFNPFAENNV